MGVLWVDLAQVVELSEALEVALASTHMTTKQMLIQNQAQHATNEVVSTGILRPSAKTSKSKTKPSVANTSFTRSPLPSAQEYQHQPILPHSNNLDLSRGRQHASSHHAPEVRRMRGRTRPQSPPTSPRARSSSDFTASPTSPRHMQQTQSWRLHDGQLR
jgi:hypothetical protein